MKIIGTYHGMPVYEKDTLAKVIQRNSLSDESSERGFDPSFPLKKVHRKSNSKCKQQ